MEWTTKLYMPDASNYDMRGMCKNFLVPSSQCTGVCRTRPSYPKKSIL